MRKIVIKLSLTIIVKLITMKKLISRFSKYDEWGYRNPQFDKLKKVVGTIIMTIIGITFITLIILEESL